MRTGTVFITLIAVFINCCDNQSDDDAIEINCDTEDTGDPNDEPGVYLPLICDSDAGICEDPNSNLIWQNPPERYGFVTAPSYCEGLVLAGRSDWRMPDIGELRTLVRGCANTEADGACCLRDDCLEQLCSRNCFGCEQEKGPAENGWYWDSKLVSDYPTFWSSSPVLHDGAPTGDGILFRYDCASPTPGYIYDEAPIRCVTDSAKAKRP